MTNSDKGREGVKNPGNLADVICTCPQRSNLNTDQLDIAEILNDVIRHTVRQHNKDKNRVEWRVLIVDQQSMRMVSACTKMQGRKSKPESCRNRAFSRFT